MLRVRIQIGDGDPIDSTAYGLVYLSADNKVGADIKGFESTSYPEQNGENIYPKTVYAPFDYKISFFIQADGSLGNANNIIADFNRQLYQPIQNSDVKIFEKVEFYNDYKRVKIVGYPRPISEATQFWRDSTGRTHDIVVVDWVIRVNDPSLCDFNLSANE